MTVGKLSVVGTPIGNIDDLTVRARNVLAECDGVIAEDGRRTRALLTAHGISNSITSLPAFDEQRRVPQLIARLVEGQHLALCTGSGTPTVSDPGAKLVAAAIAAGAEVVAIPGPSALVAALSISGLNTAHFAFIGFAPRTPSKLRRMVEAALSDDLSCVFFEAPQRLGKTLAGLSEMVGERRVAVARELTKMHETVHLGTCQTLSEQFLATAPRGECTVIIEAR